MRNRPKTSRWLRTLAESGTFFRITGTAAMSSSDTRNMAVHDTYVAMMPDVSVPISSAPWNAKPMADPNAIMAMPATSSLRMLMESANAA